MRQYEWTALQVRTGGELEILRKVRDVRDVEAIAPMERIRHRNRAREIVRPLLPGYILLRWDREASTYYAVRAVPGVMRFIGDGTPQSIPDDQMALFIALARHCETGKPAPAVRDNGVTRFAGGALGKLTIKKVNARAGRASIDVKLGDLTRTVTVAVDIKPGTGGE